jgi:transglutaminase-like putative cysteine protease
MQRYKILHRTYYNFSGEVQLEPHALRLRPRESHELHIESSTLEIKPAATLRWHRDVEDNSIAIATFTEPASQLAIESEVIIQQFNQVPLDFLVADYALDYPFTYTAEDSIVLSPYMNGAADTSANLLTEWVAKLAPAGERLQTYVLLKRLNRHIQQTLAYQVREEPGVQTAAETLARGTGSAVTSRICSCRQHGVWALLRGLSAVICTHNPPPPITVRPMPGPKCTCRARAGRGSIPPSAKSPAAVTLPWRWRGCLNRYRR